MKRIARSILVAIPLFAAILLHIGYLRDGHNWGDDFAMYIQLAHNIAEHRPYSETGYIYDPSAAIIGPPTYPPGFPLLLAPAYSMYGMNLRQMKLVVLICFLALIPVLALCFARQFTRAWLIVFLACIALNPFLLDFQDQILSDIPFALLLYSSFYAIESYSAMLNAPASRAILPACGSAILLYFTSAIRSVGVLVIPALLVYNWIRYKRISPYTLMVILGYAVLVLIQYSWVGLSKEYCDQLTVDVHTYVHNVFSYSASWAYFWEPDLRRLQELGARSPIGLVVTAGFLITAVGGFLRRVRANMLGVMDLFVLSYAIVLVIWPSNQGPRFLIPIYPIVLAYSLGILGMFQWKLPVRRVLGGSLALGAVLCYGAALTRLYTKPPADGVGSPEFGQLTDFVRTRTSPTDRLVCEKPRLISLYGRRKCSAYRFTLDQNTIWNDVRRINAKYVIVSKVFPEDREYLEPVTLSHMNELTVVFENRLFRVYRM